jgi:hypothetical protein
MLMNRLVTLIVFLFLGFLATSCELIGDIFGAGFYTGVFVVILILVILIVLFFRLFKRK